MDFGHPAGGLRGRRTGARRLVPSLATALLVLTIVVPTTARAGEGPRLADRASFVRSAVRFLSQRFEITPTNSEQPVFSFRGVCVGAQDQRTVGGSTFSPDASYTRLVIDPRRFSGSNIGLTAGGRFAGDISATGFEMEPGRYTVTNECVYEDGQTSKVSRTFCLSRTRPWSSADATRGSMPCWPCSTRPTLSCRRSP